MPVSGMTNRAEAKCGAHGYLRGVIGQTGTIALMISVSNVFPRLKSASLSPVTPRSPDSPPYIPALAVHPLNCRYHGYDRGQ